MGRPVKFIGKTARLRACGRPGDAWRPAVMTRRLGWMFAAVLLSAPAFAAEPYCAVAEICAGVPETCTPSTSRVIIAALDEYKATVQLDDGPKHESTYLSLNRVLTLIFRVNEDDHQLRIYEDDSFSYLISTPNIAAKNGKEHLVYRGTCVEG
ncbi:hypothetical protein CLV88_106140 [Shimia abyssi]|uniref:Uncharacterized protein n=2 Tax=Shimia abyssi TaxID=1662395 RepID=A0A2P8FCI3_9RHOB|nr:hypothetical protein CLV88_106140 [Shimia abyssi]